MGSIIKNFGISEGQKKGGGLWIPEAIFNSDLPATEKILLAIIGNLNSCEECFAGNEYFSKKLNLSKVRCSEILTSLEKKGKISREFLYGKNGQIEKRIINLTEGGVFDIPKGGYSEYTKDNKYSYNNKHNNKTTTNNNKYIYEISESFDSEKSSSKGSEYQNIFNLLKTSNLKEITINNIMKLVEENSIPLVRISAVLEYGKEKNWNDGAIHEAIKEDWTLKTSFSERKFSDRKKTFERSSEKIKLEYVEGEKRLQLTADLIKNNKDLFNQIFSEKLKLHKNNKFLAHAESLVQLKKFLGVSGF
ncbi:MAG: hypothetical protein ACRC6B_11590 [Fusobacteriaceae bacterium]